MGKADQLYRSFMKGRPTLGSYLMPRRGLRLYYPIDTDCMEPLMIFQADKVGMQCPFIERFAKLCFEWC